MSTKSTVSAETAETVVARDQWSCVGCGMGIMGLERGVGWSIHHRIPRGMGGSKDPKISAPSNLVVLCGSGSTGCHGDAESYRDAARARGLLVWRSQDPAEVPVEVCVQRASGLVPAQTKPYLLDNEGGRTARVEEATKKTEEEIAGARAKARSKYRRIRARRLAERVMVDGRWVHPTAPHGSNSTYNAYGCRCIPCTDAHAIGNAESRAKSLAGGRS
jgi:hypothetical protein